MKKISLLIGNDINNINNSQSWSDLLNDIVKYCGAKNELKSFDNKPFPLLYEEIFLKSIKKREIDENDLKKYIASKVSEIQANSIHKRINEIKTNNIITTNYDFSLEGYIPKRNDGIINEKLYSIFRKSTNEEKNYWHIHGDCLLPLSINLGFEHYGGQLQQIRNYVVSGTNYKSKSILKKPLVKRLAEGEINNQSWVDLFFTTDIHIFGLSLDFVETDLWWLLTYRARHKYYKKRILKKEIYYYIPENLVATSSHKLDLFTANGIEVIEIKAKDKSDYYNKVIDRINGT